MFLANILLQRSYMKSKIILIGEIHHSPDGADILHQTINYLKEVDSKINIGLEVSKFNPSERQEVIKKLLDPFSLLEMKNQMEHYFKKEFIFSLLRLKDEKEKNTFLNNVAD